MKKFLKKNIDLILFAFLLVLVAWFSGVNFKRFDLTSQGANSISQASKTTVKTLTEKLTVNLFFSDDLPSPYNETAQQVKDIMAEYKSAANSMFDYAFFDMSKKENEKLAADYGLSQVQIREMKANEMGFKNVWMGYAIVYGSQIEAVNGVDRSAGFEYNLTTKIAKLISTSDALAGLNSGEKIKLTFYRSEELKNFRISGIKEIDKVIEDTYQNVNKKASNRIEYKIESPLAEDVESLAEKYGISIVSWNKPDKTAGRGIFGLVLEYGENFKTLPLSIVNSIFGSTVAGYETLEANLNDSIQSLFSKTIEIGYITGHGEMETTNPQNGAELNLVNNLSDMYSLKQIALASDNIPGGMNTIVIAGAKTNFTDEELYKIDQFLMKGGNLMVFADSFDMQQAQNPYGGPSFVPVYTNLYTILEKYGVKPGNGYVFDEKCYTAMDQRYGRLNLYYAPTVTKENLEGSHALTKNLDFLILPQVGYVDVSEAEKNENVSVTKLIRSSARSWVEQSDIDINPMSMRVPSGVEMSGKNLAVLAEGKFNSAFEKNPAEKAEKTEFTSTSHLSKSVQKGKILVVATTQILSDGLFDKNCGEPIAMFTRNSFDYMNGNVDMCTMRTKSFTYNALKTPETLAGEALEKFVSENESDPAKAYQDKVRYQKKMVDFYSNLQNTLKIFCQFGIPVLVVIIGLLIIFAVQANHRRKIHLKFNPDDNRDSFNDKKKNSKK